MFMDFSNYSETQIASCFSNEVLELILLPTEKCNFRCTYCYEDFLIGRMPRHVIDGIKNLMTIRAPSLEQLSLSWFGGEPLLQKKICIEIAEHGLALAEKYDIQFNGGFTTNGYLLECEDISVFSRLNHAQFQITLDGDREAHDETRLLANGGGTFDRLWAKLRDFSYLDIDFKITLRLHLSPSNIDSMLRLVTRIEDEFGGDPRFSIHFHKITDLGGPNSGEFPTFGIEEYSAALAKLREITGISLKNESELDLQSNYSICYAAKPNSLLIRADGTLGKCTVAFSDERNSIGSLNPDGTLKIKQDVWRLWLKGFEDMDPDFLNCPYSKLPSLPVAERTETIDIKVLSD